MDCLMNQIDCYSNCIFVAFLLVHDEKAPYSWLDHGYDLESVHESLLACILILIVDTVSR